MKRFQAAVAQVIGLSALLMSNVWALPSLQLGPGSSSGWNYLASGDDTWYTGDSAFTLAAYANAVGGTGSDAFVKSTGPARSRTNNQDRTAYLVFSAVPSTTSTTPFSLSVIGDSGPLALVQQGFGSPPDPDSGKSTDDLPSHSIYDTYFYVYEFNFDGSAGTIPDTQAGQTGSGTGYTELFNVTVNSLEAGVGGVHMDLFTVVGDGKLKTTDVNGDSIAPGDLSNQIYANAPFSHDAQYSVPEPSVLSLLALVALGLGWRGLRAG